jgi:hypothetical protein
MTLRTAIAVVASVAKATVTAAAILRLMSLNKGMLLIAAFSFLKRKATHNQSIAEIEAIRMVINEHNPCATNSTEYPKVLSIATTNNALFFIYFHLL